MTQELVSIIVPVYNTAEYVEECIQSILSQSYKNIELILVNDGSTDSSGIICRKYNELPNVKYFEQEKLGVTIARKRGVEEAKGEWIMFVDSDDLILENAVEELLKYTENTDIVVARSQVNKDLLEAPDSYSWNEYLYRLYSNDGISGAPWAKMIRRKLILDSPLAFEYNIIRTQDYLMNLGIAITNRKCVNICKQAIYVHRMRESSTIHTVHYSYDYLYELCSIADSMVKDFLSDDEMVRGSIRKHMYFINMIIPENNYEGNPNHPFVKDIKRYMDEAGVWRPMDRWLLSVSSPWAVKTVWNLRKVWVRIEDPSMILRDIKRLAKFFA
jgi:glycosyltransferase involved in cell wall biosynthesis